MYPSLTSVLPNHHIVSGLKQHDIILQVRRSEVPNGFRRAKNKTRYQEFFLEDLEGNLVFAFF